MRPTPAVTATPVLAAPATGAPDVERITRFYAAHPTGRIITELVTRARGVVVFRAAVYRGADDAQPASTGWAAAGWGLGPPVERAEEVAVARALAHLGFAHGRAARRAGRADAAAAPAARAPDARTVAEMPNSGPVCADEAAPAEGWPADAGPTDARIADARVADEAVADADGAPRSHGTGGDDRADLADAAAGARAAPGGRAELAADLALLVRRAERYGLRARRAARWRARLASSADEPAVLRAAERRLRAWVERRRAEPYAGAV